MSQAQLGEPYFTRDHVSAIVLGKIRPAMRSLEHMAKKLDKPASYFLDDADLERARGERELEIGAIGGLLTFASAAEALRRAEKALDTGNLSVRETARGRLHAGSALNLLQRGREAIKTLTVAQRLAGELGDEPLGRAADYQLAVATRIAGNPRGAREALETLLRRIETAKPPDQLLRLRVLITMGGCAQDLGEPQAATTYYQQALEWSSEIGDLARIAFIHQGLGNAYRALGAVGERGADADRAVAGATLVLAELDLRDGDAAKAEQRMRDVAVIYKGLDAKAELGDVLMRLSRSAKKHGDLRAAERYASQAYAVSKPKSANVEV